MLLMLRNRRQSKSVIRSNSNDERYVCIEWHTNRTHCELLNGYQLTKRTHNFRHILSMKKLVCWLRGVKIRLIQKTYFFPLWHSYFEPTERQILVIGKWRNTFQASLPFAFRNAIHHNKRIIVFNWIPNLFGMFLLRWHNISTFSPHRVAIHIREGERKKGRQCSCVCVCRRERLNSSCSLNESAPLCR